MILLPHPAHDLTSASLFPVKSKDVLSDEPLLTIVTLTGEVISNIGFKVDYAVFKESNEISTWSLRFMYCAMRI